MTDRELLELAAKAAGLILDKSQYSGSGGNTSGFDISGNAVLDWHNCTTWNPLLDDGDAFRLAVKLRMRVDSWCVGVCSVASINNRAMIAEPHYGDDPERATRRAIVRAAAELAKQENS